MFRTTSRSFRVSASAAVLVCVAASVAESATVAGNVVDSTTSLPLAGVEVLVDGVPSGVTTDISGQFKAEVTEGERLFTSSAPVSASKASVRSRWRPKARRRCPRRNWLLSPPTTSVMLDALDVSGDLVKGGSGDLQNTRLKADVAIDFLSADEFAKFGAGDIAESLIRIPGVSVANGQFAVIRGLSDRYTPTSLSGLKIPSPDPEKQAPQMDFLPTSLVETWWSPRPFRLICVREFRRLDRSHPQELPRGAENQRGIRREGEFQRDRRRWSALQCDRRPE